MKQKERGYKGQNVLYTITGILALGVIASLAWYFHSPMSYSGGAVETAATSTSAQPFSFEIATTTAAQERGLGGRAVIPSDYGMLFVFPADGRYGFWMKDMKASIDMIWITDSGTIAGIASDVAPDTYPSVFYPPSPIRYVLETRVGEAASHGWNIGSTIPLPAPYNSASLQTLPSGK